MTAAADRYRPELAVGVTSARIRDVSPAARALHQAILRGFATTGRAPDPAALPATSPAGQDVRVLLRELHERDVVRLDGHGRIRAAYPFSAVPTAHAVAIAGGPTVWAMCAIDALGIGDMLGTDVTITSADPGSGEPIRVEVRDGQAAWQPDTTVVFVGSDATALAAAEACCPPDGDCVVAAEDRCCGVMNFFTSRDSAQSWLADHRQVTGVMLTQGQALRLGVDIFGRLLDD
jgi:Alkylmercury lyase